MTISEEYRKQIRNLHEVDAQFGGGSYADVVAQIVMSLESKSICDYGAGKQKLNHYLKVEHGTNIPYFPFDPAYPEYGPPKKADLLCCIEVLEHIEPELLDQVLKQISEFTESYAFLTIHCTASTKTLPDGRNAHLIQMPTSWWLKKLSDYFEVQWLRKTSKDGFAVLVSNISRDDLSLEKFEVLQFSSMKQQIGSFVFLLKRELKRRLK
jgi:hypothetical protein